MYEEMVDAEQGSGAVLQMGAAGGATKGEVASVVIYDVEKARGGDGDGAPGGQKEPKSSLFAPQHIRDDSAAEAGDEEAAGKASLLRPS